MQQAVEAEMGKTEQGQLFLTANLQRKIAGGRTIYCPCLAGLPAEVALSVGILPVHDANQVLLDGLEGLNIDPKNTGPFLLRQPHGTPTYSASRIENVVVGRNFRPLCELSIHVWKG